MRTPIRLYKLNIDESKGKCLLSKVEEETWLWHIRLGHVNFQAMQLMAKNKMVNGLPNLRNIREVCNGCLLAKQARTPFPSKSCFIAKDVLELIHGDLCGPISPDTPAGNKYFLLLVDVFSRMMWVYMINQRMRHCRVLNVLKP